MVKSIEEIKAEESDRWKRSEEYYKKFCIESERKKPVVKKCIVDFLRYNEGKNFSFEEICHELEINDTYERQAASEILGYFEENPKNTERIICLKGETRFFYYKN